MIKLLNILNEITVNNPSSNFIEWDNVDKYLDSYNWVVKKSPIHGQGLFAYKNKIPKNAIFLIAGYSDNMYYGASHINHSFNSNSIVLQTKTPHSNILYLVKAKKDIKPGEEITINYKTLPPNFDRDTTGFINEITVNPPIKPRILIGPGIETTSVKEFIKYMEDKGYGFDRLYKTTDNDVQSSNPTFDYSWKIGLPKFRGLNGPIRDLTTKNKIYYETWEQNDSMWESININSYDSDVIKKVVKGFRLIPFEQGFNRAFKSTSQKASPQLSQRINKWIKDKFPESKVRAEYEQTYQTINFPYYKTTNEITVNKPNSNISGFLNRHKQEVWDKIVKNEVNKEEIEEYNLPENLKFITYYHAPTLSYIDKPEIGLDLSFNKEDVTEEDNPYWVIDKTKIAGRTVYYCRYNI